MESARFLPDETRRSTRARRKSRIAIVGQIAGGGVGGAIVMVIVGLIKQALSRRLPVASPNSSVAPEGGLVSLGTDRHALVRRAAIYVDKILKGAKPADLPVERPSTFKLSVNVKTAKALGLTIPQTLLLRADEVIQ